MSRRAPVLLLLALVLSPAAAAEPPRSGIVHVQLTPGTTPVQHGAELYAANCSTCHGIAGAGITHRSRLRGAGDVGGLGPELATVGAQAADFYLRTGYMPLSRPGMQPRRTRVLFSERELHDLIAYVASLGKGPPIPTPDPASGNLSDGLRLFTDHCAGCHQVSAAGGVVTGAYVPALQSATAVQIAEAVRIGPYLMPRFPTSQISDADLNSIVKYVLYARHPDDRGGWALGRIGPVPEGLVTWFIAAVALVGTCLVIGKRLQS
jgi:quinol---cytochrome-c reductase cytochrome c subunit